MDFNDMQEGVMQNAINYGKHYGVTISEDFALLKLYEEVGELAQAILIHRKESRPEKHLSEADSKKAVARELADVVGMAMVNAKLLGIDLEGAIKEKWIGREK